MLFVDIGPSIQLIRAGKAVALGVTSAEPVASAPEIQPLAKVGLPGFDTTAWQMIVAPGGDAEADPRKAQSDDQCHRRTMRTSQEARATSGMIPLGKQSLPQLDAFVKSETANWAPVIKNAGLAGSQGEVAQASSKGRGER